MQRAGVYSDVRKLIGSALPLVVFFSLLAAGCGPTVDLTQALQVQSIATGWSDAGVVDGKTKLVPTFGSGSRMRPIRSCRRFR